MGKTDCPIIKKPNFFIVGSPKCGTTAMAEYLSFHPAIYMPTKEMHFFGSDLHFGRRFYRRDLAAYLAEYAAWDGEGRAGDASVWYLLSRRAAAEIKAFNPDSSIIIMLREPVEMLYSLYYQLRFDANEHLPTFEEALAAESDRKAGRRLSRDSYFSQGLIYRGIGQYTEQVSRYFDTFGRDRVRVITYDEFACDTRATYQGTLEFLGVNAAHFPGNFKVINACKRVKSRMLRAVLADPLVRSLAISISLSLGQPVFKALRRVETRLWRMNTSESKRPPLSAETRAQLMREFAPEIERLSVLLGRDLTYWSRNQKVVANGVLRQKAVAQPAPEWDNAGEPQTFA